MGRGGGAKKVCVTELLLLWAPGARSLGPWEAAWSTSQHCPTGVFVTNSCAVEGHSRVLIPGAFTENDLGQRESGSAPGNMGN